MHGVVLDISAIFSSFYVMYFCICVHLVVVSSIRWLCTKTKAQAVLCKLPCIKTQSKCRWGRKAESRMRKLVCHVILKPLWIALRPCFLWSCPCGIFILPLKRPFCCGYFWDGDGWRHAPTNSFSSTVRSRAWIFVGCCKVSRAKGIPCFVLFHYHARASLILKSPIQSTESKIVKPTVVCTKARYGNIRTASLVQYVVHYADQLMPKSNTNQRTAQNTKVKKALEDHPAHLCAQNDPYKDICSPFSGLQMTQTEGHLTLPSGSPTHLVRFLDAMFLVALPSPNLNYPSLSLVFTPFISSKILHIFSLRWAIHI